MIEIDNNVLDSRMKDWGLLQSGVRTLQQRLPQGWGVELLPIENQAGDPALALGMTRVRLSAPDRKWSDLLVAGKIRLEPRMVRLLVDPAGASPSLNPCLVIAPYLSRPTQQELRERGIGYVDLSGNIWLSVRKPGLFVEAIGATEEPDREERPARTLKGQKAGSRVFPARLPDFVRAA